MVKLEKIKDNEYCVIGDIPTYYGNVQVTREDYDENPRIYWEITCEELEMIGIENLKIKTLTRDYFPMRLFGYSDNRYVDVLAKYFEENGIDFGYGRIQTTLGDWEEIVSDKRKISLILCEYGSGYYLWVAIPLKDFITKYFDNLKLRKEILDMCNKSQSDAAYHIKKILKMDNQIKAACYVLKEAATAAQYREYRENRKNKNLWKQVM